MSYIIVDDWEWTDYDVWCDGCHTKTYWGYGVVNTLTGETMCTICAERTGIVTYDAATYYKHVAANRQNRGK